MKLGKKIVSFSLWGNDPKYTDGAVQNAELVKIHYPTWIARFYVAKNVPENIKSELLKRDAEVIVVDEPINWTSTFWRFYAVRDADVDVVVSRDTDSRLGKREAEAVKEWMNSNCDFHIMRDHPAHATEILAGMWGAKKQLFGIIEQLLATSPRAQETKQADQIFLRSLYPFVSSKAMVHDPFFENRPFPTKRVGADFVGQVYENNEPCALFAEDLLKNPKSREEDRPVVILSSTRDALYADCAELVTTAWESLGYLPVLALVGPSSGSKVKVSATTHVINVEPIEGLTEGFVAQTIRVLLPLMFPDDICITGDIDMVPMSKEYFDDLVEKAKQGKFVVASSDAYPKDSKRFPICYFTGKGSDFDKILNIDTSNTFWLEDTLKEWNSKGFGWDTDEIVFSDKLLGCTNIDVLLDSRGWFNNQYGRIARDRIDRVCWSETLNHWQKTGSAIDAHLPRPFGSSKALAKTIMEKYGL